MKDAAASFACDSVRNDERYHFKTLAEYQHHEKLLLAAYERAKAVEERYKALIQTEGAWRKNCPNGDFNDVYDLQWRLEQRLKALQSNYYDWHWDQHGWNAYA
jgi:hypothetical protein